MSKDNVDDRQSVKLFGLTSSGDWKAFPSSTLGPPIMMDWVHSRGHAGKFFSVSSLWNSTGQIANGAFGDVLFVCEMECHLVIETSCGGNAELYFYEDPTCTGGTELTIRNKYRASSNIPGCKTFRAPTVSDVGTELWPSMIPGGSGGNANGSISAWETEWIVAAGHSYLFRLKNVSGQAQGGYIGLNWYEP